MTRLLEGRVAFVTGAARGQGRSHALRLAGEGAAIVAIDADGPVATHNAYPPAEPGDLAETVRLVREAGGAAEAAAIDVRDSRRLEEFLATAVHRLGGRLDVVVANAGISNWNRFWEMDDEQWTTMIDVNLTGVWRTIRAAVPLMIDAGHGGSMILVSSVAGLKSLPGAAHYSAAKHGVVGLANSAAIELAEFDIRVNTVHPWAVDTPMAKGEGYRVVYDAHPHYLASFGSVLPRLPTADADDISNGIVWLASDLSRAVTGLQMTMDMGATKI
jgi:SDR family mycofactocin-dependent oxidoreductase